jgi:hypothetical protein
MGAFDTDWKQQWETFLKAPYIIASFMFVAGLIGWWLSGIKSGRRIDGLDAQLKIAHKRAAWAIEVRDDVIGKFQTYRAEVTANAGNSTLAATAAKLETALDKLVAATNAVRSATGISVGSSTVTGISDDSFSNTPLALRVEAEGKAANGGRNGDAA